jgi:hypothetical protein
MMISSSPAITCAENIAILYLLHKVVEPQKTNSGPLFGAGQETRRLCLEQESDLTRTRAFLAGVADDPRHIAALCVEEDEALGGLRVVVAINKTSPDDGSELLATMRSGFRDIFLILEGVSKGMQGCQLVRVQLTNWLRRSQPKT